MGMGIEIANKIYNINTLESNIKEESSRKNLEDDNINLKINKSLHFSELHNRIKGKRKNTAPEYLFDEKSRKLFYSLLFTEVEDINFQKNKNNWEKELTNSENENNNNKNDDTFNINIIHKKRSYDMSERKIKNDDLTLDFELNYYKKGEELRNRYMSQLINKGIWLPKNEKKNYNSIIIFDWDDTLLPTSFLVKKGIFSSLKKFTKYEKKKLSELEDLILQLLTLVLNKGDVYIITNADKGWVEYSCKVIYPKLNISNILQKIKIISAKNKYQRKFPGDSRIWKIKTFINLTKDIDVKKITNIICSGDSAFEIEAGKILASKFNQAFIKAIKLKEKPELEEVWKQIMLIFMQFNAIHSAAKNLTIRVEQKKKEE